MRIKSNEWEGAELCAMMDRKNFLRALRAVGEQELPARYLFELRLVEKAVIRTSRADWVTHLIRQAGEDWISSFFGYLDHAAGRWSSLNTNADQVIEYELKEAQGV